MIWGRVRRASSRLLGFGVVPALSLVSSVVLLPLVAHRFGPDGWSAVSIGSAVGAYVGVIVGLSWPVVGPHLVAAAGAEGRRAIFVESLRSRGTTFLLVIIPAAVISGLLTARTGFSWTSVLVAVGVGLNGFTASWYFAGAGTPWVLVRNEASVRFLVYLAIILALSAGAPFWVYGAFLVASGLLMILVNCLTVLTGAAKRNYAGAPVSLPLREHISGTLARLSNSSFVTLTPVLFALSAAPALSTFAALDQVQKAASNGLGAVPQAFIGFVAGKGGGTKRLNRLRLAIWVSAVCAAAVITAWSLCGGFVVDVLYRGKVSPGFLQLFLVGVAVASAFLAQFLQQVVLVPLGQVRKSYVAMSAISLSAIPAFLLSSIAWGVTGALLVVACSMTLTALVYLLLAVRAFRLPASVQAAAVPGA